MHPMTVLSFGPITVYTYGVLLAAAYLLGLQARDGPRARRAASTPTACSTSASTSSSARSIGAKLLLLITDFRSFTANPRELLTLARSGGVFYGGLILAVIVALLVHPQDRPAAVDDHAMCSRRASRSATSSAASAACSPAAAAASRPTLPWGITFTDPFAAANVGTPLNVPLHPTQLYEAGAELLILDRAARHRTEGPHVRRAGRSGSTCCSTRSRGSSSSSSAATSAARSACSRRRSSSRSCSRRSPS